MKVKYSYFPLEKNITALKRNKTCLQNLLRCSERRIKIIIFVQSPLHHKISFTNVQMNFIFKNKLKDHDGNITNYECSLN